MTARVAFKFARDNLYQKLKSASGSASRLYSATSSYAPPAAARPKVPQSSKKVFSLYLLLLPDICMYYIYMYVGMVITLLKLLFKAEQLKVN